MIYESKFFLSSFFLIVIGFIGYIWHIAQKSKADYDIEKKLGGKWSTIKSRRIGKASYSVKKLIGQFQERKFLFVKGFVRATNIEFIESLAIVLLPKEFDNIIIKSLMNNHNIFMESWPSIKDYEYNFVEIEGRFVPFYKNVYSIKTFLPHKTPVQQEDQLVFMLEELLEMEKTKN